MQNVAEQATVGEETIFARNLGTQAEWLLLCSFVWGD